jgi:hypothetical protein
MCDGDVRNPCLRLGFVLGRTGVAFPYRPGTTYRGVDRLPFVPTLQEEEDLNRVGRATLISLWHRYADLLFTGELHADGQLAKDLRGEFAGEGLDFEVVYAEVLGLTQSEAETRDDKPAVGVCNRLRRHHERAARRPEGATLLGYDVSYPLPSFHSALFQPGFREKPNTPDLDLNSAGLLSDLDQLRQILPLANAMVSAWHPFCGIGVYLAA